MARTVASLSPFIIRKLTEHCACAIAFISEFNVYHHCMEDIDTNETYLQSAASCVSLEEVNFPYPKLFVAYNKQPSLVFGIKRNQMLCESGRLRNRVNSRLEIGFIAQVSIPGGGAENALKHHQTERDHATKDPVLF